MPMATGSNWRIALGFLLAPTVGILAFPLAMCTTEALFWSRGTSATEFGGCLRETIPIIGLFSAIPALVITAVFGIPLYWVFVQRRWLSWWQVMLGGALCAIPVPVLLAVLSMKLSMLGDLLAFGLPVGLLSGLTFWALAVRRNAL